MTTLSAPAKPLTLAEYLQWQAPDNDNKLYELEDGVVREMPLESELNRRVAVFLLAYFLQQGIPPQRLSQKTEIAVSGAKASTRLPDLLVLTEAAEEALRGASRSVILHETPPPALVVEVVSPGEENRVRDYRYKRAQYQARGIEEYWIVDPQQGTVTVLSLRQGLYEESVFQESDLLRSPFLTRLAPEAALTVAAILQREAD
ncbi:MAG: Uma2 family endonuclease [Cyanobacteriota bacterium]|jgi:Uma2 family endonuclease